MNTFSTGSSATPTIARAPSQVQTGGFGDPNGIPAKAGQGKAVNIAAAGSFDLPSGPGSVNGTGGAKGVPGVVASSGFGNGTATTENRPRANTVQASGFASADVPSCLLYTSGEQAGTESCSHRFDRRSLQRFRRGKRILCSFLSRTGRPGQHNCSALRHSQSRGRSESASCGVSRCSVRFLSLIHIFLYFFR